MAYLKVLTVESLDPTDGAEGKSEAVTTGASSMSLARERRRSRCAGAADEAGRGSGKADVGFREVQLADVVPASLSVLLALGDVRVRRGDGQFGSDLVQGRLGVGEPELVLEERGLGWVSIRAGQIEARHGVNQLLGSRLGLLDQI